MIADADHQGWRVGGIARNPSLFVRLHAESWLLFPTAPFSSCFSRWHEFTTRKHWKVWDHRTLYLHQSRAGWDMAVLAFDWCCRSSCHTSSSWRPGDLGHEPQINEKRHGRVMSPNTRWGSSIGPAGVLGSTCFMIDSTWAATHGT